MREKVEDMAGLAAALREAAVGSELSQDTLRAICQYDHETGFFYNRRQRGWLRAHAIMGGHDGLGYIRMRICGAKYKAHRLAFLWMIGRWPDGDVDHINGLRDDNRWGNLRECTRTQNMQNARVYSNSKIGLKGVNPQNGRFYSRIKVNGKLIHLGIFDTAEEAHASYCARADELFGPFARYS